MTLHELAEALRKVAYDLDESNRLWDNNDQHVIRLNRRISDLELSERAARVGMVTAKAALAKAEAKLRRLRGKRKGAK